MEAAIRQAKKALGPLPGAKDIRKALTLNLDDDFYQPYVEKTSETQSVQEFISMQSNQSSDRFFTRPILVVPINMPSTDIVSPLVQALKTFLDIENVNLSTLPSVPMKTQQQILQVIQRHVDETSSVIIGLMSGPIETFIQGNILLLSLDPSTACLSQQFQTLVHHLLHVFQIKHCGIFNCLMNPDMCEGSKLCLHLDPICLRKLYSLNPKLNPSRRYAQLAQERCMNDSKWFEFRKWCAERHCALTGEYIAPEISIDPSKLQLLKKKYPKIQRRDVIGQN